jgi:thioester reductase-like protein
VRAEGEAAAQDRLIEHLESYELWRSELSGRVRAIAGDLEKAQMGLDAESFATIAARTDVIYHCAGWLNMAFPYSRLKPVNVGGTIEVLRLAGSITTKPVHFISRSLRRMGGLV